MIFESFNDPFEKEPTEEEYNKYVKEIDEFIKSHPGDKVFVHLTRRVYCPRCHLQMEQDAGAYICRRCNVRMTDRFEYVTRNGSRKTYFEQYPGAKQKIKENFSDMECIDPVEGEK